MALSISDYISITGIVISILGTAISIIGLYHTFKQAKETKKAAQAALLASEETKERIHQIDSIILSQQLSSQCDELINSLHTKDITASVIHIRNIINNLALTKKNDQNEITIHSNNLMEIYEYIEVSRSTQKIDLKKITAFIPKIAKAKLYFLTIAPDNKSSLLKTQGE